MSQPGDDPSGETGPLVTISSEVMVAAVLFLFITVVFVFFLYLYAKHYWTPAARRRSRARARFISAADPIHGPRRGIDPAVLRALPVTVFRSSVEPVECPVCLSELSDGEATRVLPKCSHSFHVECIDEWFQSHSTCPLCRSAVAADAVPSGTVALDITINVRLSGDPASGSSAGSSSAAGKQGGELVIEIPRRGGAVEGMQSPSSAGLRSLKRLWSSRGKRVVGSSSSSPMGVGVGGDLELGLAGEEGSAAAAATPETHPH